MALDWFWDFGIGLPRTDYVASDWDVTGTTVEPDSTANLNAPSGGTHTPGDQANCRISSGGFLQTPALPPIAAGAVAGRWQWVTGSMSSASTRPILRIKNGSTVLIDVRGDINGGGAVPLRLTVDGVDKGATTTAFDQGDVAWLSVVFDLSANPWSVQLYVNGIEEINVTEPAAATTADRIELGGGGGTSTWNTVLRVDDAVADLGLATDADTWSTTLNVDTVTPDVNWSIFGGAPSDLAALNDADSATGLETTTAASVVDATAEDRNDILSGWSPTVIHAAQAVVLASADVLTSIDLELKDASGTAVTENATLTSSPDFVVALSLVNSAAAAWAGADIDDLNLTYTVT